MSREVLETVACRIRPVMSINIIQSNASPYLGPASETRDVYTQHARLYRHHFWLLAFRPLINRLMHSTRCLSFPVPTP